MLLDLVNYNYPDWHIIFDVGSIVLQNTVYIASTKQIKK